MLYSFYPYSKIPQLYTIQTRALEIARKWAPLNDTIIAFHDLMPPKEHGIFFGLYLSLIATLLESYGRDFDSLFVVLESSFPLYSYSSEHLEIMMDLKSGTVIEFIAL